MVLQFESGQLGRSFAGRSELVDQIKTIINKTSNNSLMLVGGVGVGKAEVFKQFVREDTTLGGKIRMYLSITRTALLIAGDDRIGAFIAECSYAHSEGLDIIFFIGPFLHRKFYVES